MATAISQNFALPNRLAPNQSPQGAPPPPNNSLGQDAFLKLLVAQLRYQDPTKPTDPQAFIAQTAQFTQVEKLEQIAKQNTDNIRTQGLSTASALIGRTIKYQDEQGVVKSGTVTGAALNADGVRLKLGTQFADLNAVVEVGGAVP